MRQLLSVLTHENTIYRTRVYQKQDLNPDLPACLIFKRLTPLTKFKWCSGWVMWIGPFRL